jgi:type III secretion protein C
MLISCIDIEDGQVNDARVDTLPTVSSSTVSTEATVLDGESLLIAGYGSDRKINARKQVPILGDLPAIGSLFSDTTRTLQKRERMFVIRPRVVGYPGQPAASGGAD